MIVEAVDMRNLWRKVRASRHKESYLYLVTRKQRKVEDLTSQKLDELIVNGQQHAHGIQAVLDHQRTLEKNTSLRMGKIESMIEKLMGEVQGFQGGLSEITQKHREK
jgi:hypothetical protein